jgi:chaperonin GroES
MVELGSSKKVTLKTAAELLDETLAKRLDKTDNSREEFLGKAIGALSADGIVDSKSTYVIPAHRRAVVKPLWDNIVIVADENITEVGTIKLAEEKRRLTGVVIAVGHGYRTTSGAIPLLVKINDRVMFNKYGGQEVQHDGRYYLVIKESDITMIIEEDIPVVANRNDDSDDEFIDDSDNNLDDGVSLTDFI